MISYISQYINDPQFETVRQIPVYLVAKAFYQNTMNLYYIHFVDKKHVQL
jgi:hypothetical protein